FIDRADQQANPNREQLHFRKGHLHVACDHESLVEHAIKDFDEARRPRCSFSQCRHRSSILRDNRVADRETGNARWTCQNRPISAMVMPPLPCGFRWRTTRSASNSDKQRSEEHTSELQSPYDLVCRLL